MTSTTALIVVDVQNDFADPNGSLYVAGGEQCAADINGYLRDFGDTYRAVVASKDWHPNDASFSHFSVTPDFDETWPMHCVQGTWGAEFHRSLQPVYPHIRHTFFKGRDSAAYSAFEGATELTHDTPPDGEGITLWNYLIDREVETVDVCGLALDYCVLATALDAENLGFTTRVLGNFTRGVSALTGLRAMERLQEHKIEIVQ